MMQKNTSLNPLELQALANQALSDLAPIFLEHTRADIQSMLAFLKQAHSADPEERYTLIREDFFRKAHDMKGEGETFDYPLLTFMGAIMCDYMRHKTKIGMADLKFLQKCMADVQTIFNQKITGDGGSFGKNLHTKWENK